MRTRNNILLFVTGVLFSSLISCSEGEVYYRFYHIDKGNWYHDSTLIFTMDSLNVNVAQAYDVTIEVSSGHLYPYRNIWLQIDHNLTDTLIRSDTLQYHLADDHGKWLGSGVGGLHQLSLPFLNSIPLDTAHLYRLSITQVMKDDPLAGIEKVGLKVTEVNREEK
ncbi:MAG: gliding motility lipoprotein GldH [Proteiniphilum sp.]|nr:gliding motility lipoprotein GldH [Proteiniphilum sp.]